MKSYRRVVCSLGFALLATPTAWADELHEKRFPYTPTATNQEALKQLSDHGTTAFSGHVFQSSFGALPYRLLSPPKDSGKAPMVLVLHGSGQMGTDNVRQMGLFAKAWAEPAVTEAFSGFVVVPQVSVRSADYATDDTGQLFAEPGASFDSLMALVDDLAAHLPVDASRIYIVGFSMGASTALQALVRRPDRFAAAAAFSPVPPRRDLATTVANKPIMLVHGSADTENPFSADHLWALALADAGGHPNVLTYDNMDHRVPPDMILGTDWRAWLFAQRLD